MKLLKLTLFFSLLLFISWPLATAAANLDDASSHVELNKSWTIHFNKVISAETVTKDTVYVLNSKNEKEPVTYTYINTGKSLVIAPPQNGYLPEQTYTLVITDGVKSKNKSLTTTVKKPFTIKAVEKALVITSRTAVTNLYTDATLTKAVSFVDASSYELIDVTAQSVAINVAGVTRYVSPKDVMITEDLSTQSYLEVKNNQLIHSVYNYRKGYFEPYTIGQAPAFLKSGETYYSADAGTFKDKDGNIVGESYAYFQYISPRTKSNYSAAQLDAYIDTELAKRKITNSKLVGLGTHLKAAEEKYTLNALFLLAFAVHESSYGTSDHAQKHNNLFGLKVYDSGSQTKTYDAPEESIADLAEDFLNKNYIPADMGAYSNGVALGNKFVGFNVSYASDPYWGSKIAGHMYTIDKALGSLDYKQYDIGLMQRTTGQFPIRPKATNQLAAIYSVRNPFGKPLTIVENQGDWLQILSDEPNKQPYGYAFANEVRIIDTH